MRLPSNSKRTWKFLINPAKYVDIFKKKLLYYINEKRSSVLVNRKTLFILIFIVNIILTIIAYSKLPETVAIHFSGGGFPDSWGSKTIHTAIFTVLDFLLFFIMYYTPKLIMIFPAKFINLPNKQYWLHDVNRNELMNRLSVLMWEYGAVLFTFLFVTQLLVIQANLRDPVRLDQNAFLIALGVFFIYTVYWTIKMYRTFKVPPEQSI
jgi:uncharacterized membrane protein